MNTRPNEKNGHSRAARERSVLYSDDSELPPEPENRPLPRLHPEPLKVPPPPPPSSPKAAPPVTAKIVQPGQKTLLNISVLTLSREIRLSRAHPGRVVIKYQPGHRYLTVTLAQWHVLKCFEDGHTVPFVLKQLIHDRVCIPLSEFYEIILQACANGVLQTPGNPLPPKVSAEPWTYRVTSARVRPVSVVILLGSILLLILHPVQAPSHWLWWAPGWLLLCVAVNAGNFLGACVLNGDHGDLYNLRIIRRSLFPRFAIDLDDAILGGDKLAVDIALAQLVPFALLATLTSFCAPSLALPLFWGLLWKLAPARQNPGLRLLRALQHSPRLSTAENFHFTPNQTLLHRVREHLNPVEIRFLLLRAGYTIPWLLLVAVTVVATTRFDFAGLWRDVIQHNLSTFALLAVLVVAAGVLSAVLALVCAIIWQTWKIHQRDKLLQDERDRASLYRPAPDIQAIVQFLGETHPFQYLNLNRRELIAQTIRQTPFCAGATVIARGDKLTRLYLLYSGSVRIVTPDAAKPDRILLAGCIFGESVLLDGGAQPADAIGVVPGIVLSFDREVYDELVAPMIPRHRLEDATQKVAFLRQIGLSRHWPTHLLDGFARRADLRTFGYESVLLHEGRENLWFYVVREGELRVVRGRRTVGRLRPGDFFGEISLLQNSLTTAKVIGHVPGTYFAIPKQNFFLFLTQNYEVALQFEAIASKRLGRPIFPLNVGATLPGAPSRACFAPGR